MSPTTCPTSTCKLTVDVILTMVSEDRVRAGAAKLSKMLAAKQQGRLDGFFSVKPKEEGAKGKGKGDDKKRKGDDKGGAKKKGKK